MSRQRILLTGASGFIGRHVLRRCRQAGHQVTGVDLRPPPPQDPPAAASIVGHFASSELLAAVSAGRFDTVIHHAAITDTRVTASPHLTRTNTQDAFRLATASRTGRTRFIYASSHSVYGQLKHRRPIAESADRDPTACSGPLNPYARSKLDLDALMTESGSINTPWFGLRYTNVFGAEETDKGPMASILTQLLRAAASRGHVSVYRDTLTAARDYLPVETVASTITLLLDTAIPSGVYNLGSGHPISFAEILESCAELLSRKCGRTLEVSLIQNRDPAAYQYLTWADTTKLDDALPERPHSPREELRRRIQELFNTFYSLTPSTK
ncbi:MAG: NAD(P)-dependent oxidoreductase [Actinomycetota bacterium]|nr:NAD(P)-dependent oxidoreductase [Actinomycetota bacterium]